jgi:hypothetical protein
LKPPVIYYGAKTRVAEQITAMLPEHAHYVEPCCSNSHDIPECPDDAERLSW